MYKGTRINEKNQLQDLEDHLPEDIAPFVEVKGVTCLNLCNNFKYTKAPYVKVDDEIITEATIEKILACITSKFDILRSGK